MLPHCDTISSKTMPCVLTHATYSYILRITIKKCVIKNAITIKSSIVNLHTPVKNHNCKSFMRTFIMLLKCMHMKWETWLLHLLIICYDMKPILSYIINGISFKQLNNFSKRQLKFSSIPIRIYANVNSLFFCILFFVVMHSHIYQFKMRRCLLAY